MAPKFLNSNIVRNTIIFGVGCTLLVAGASLFFITKIRYTMHKEATSYLHEVGRQGAQTINTKIEGAEDWLSAIADLLGRYTKMQDVYAILNFLDQEKAARGYKDMGIIMPERTAILTTGLTWEMLEKYNHPSPQSVEENKLFIEKAFQANGPALSPVLLDKEDNTEIMIMTAPIKSEDKPLALLFATTRLEDYKEYLSVTYFNGQGYSYLVTHTGDIILNSDNPNNVLDKTDNIFEELKQPHIKLLREYSIEKIRAEMAAGLEGDFSFDANGLHKHVHFTPIGINDWYMLSIIATNNINKREKQLLITGFVFTTLLVALFVAISVFLAITSKNNRETLLTVAFEDPVTQCKNLNRFKLELPAILKAYPQKHFALVLFDIDRFKIINNLYTYKQGNLVLQHVSNVLGENLHLPDIFARSLNDVFIALISYTSDANLIHRIKDLNKKLKNCYALTGRDYTINFSFGIYKITDMDMEYHTMFDRANIARREAKKNLLIDYMFYSPEFEKNLIQKKFVENNIKKALFDHEIQVYLQPRIKLSTGEIVGAEALARWIQPTKNIIQPDQFIPVLESTGHIIELDLYMLKNTAQFIHQWQKKGLQALPLSVNQSRLHLANPDYAKVLEKIISAENIKKTFIELELTEGALFDNISLLPKLAQDLHAIGFALSMDDFGSGYSSLNMLKDVSVDLVKLDKAFLSDFETNPRAKFIIEFSVKMIHQLGIAVLAEGVETKEQADFLKSIGCDYAQGYYFAKPMPAQDFIKYLTPAKGHK